MTERKPFTLVAAVLFGLMAAVHIYRIAVPFDVTIGQHAIPYSASLFAAALLAVLAIMLVRESRR